MRRPFLFCKNRFMSFDVDNTFLSENILNYVKKKKIKNGVSYFAKLCIFLCNAFNEKKTIKIIVA